MGGGVAAKADHATAVFFPGARGIMGIVPGAMWLRPRSEKHAGAAPARTLMPSRAGGCSPLAVDSPLESPDESIY